MKEPRAAAMRGASPGLRKGPARPLPLVVGMVVMAGLCALILLPLGWMLTVALTPDHFPVFTVPPQWFPSAHWEWGNFSRALFDPLRPFAVYLRNSIIIVGSCMLGTAVSTSLAGYVFARLRFRGKKALFNIVIITMLVPWQALMIPQFLVFYSLGMYGTYLPLILPSFAGNAMLIFLVRQYMRSLPRALDEAALLDGCNHLQILGFVILPLSAPALVVALTLTFFTSWNDLLGPLLYLVRNEQFTVSLGLANYVSSRGTKYNLLMAANLVTMLPPLVLYFLIQKKLLGGIAAVSIKG